MKICNPKPVQVTVSENLFLRPSTFWVQAAKVAEEPSPFFPLFQINSFHAKGTSLTILREQDLLVCPD